jgi:DnaD/phage-associated family protein
MAWTRIDDKFYENSKILDAGPLGAHLYIAGLIHCNVKRTDGFIADCFISGIGGDAFDSKRFAKKLVENKLWDRVEGGYQVHDFLQFNKSKEEIERLNFARKDNGKTGGRPSKTNQQVNQQVNQDQNQQVNQEHNPARLNVNEEGETYNLPNIPNQSLQTDKTDEGGSARGKVFVAYENEIGLLTPFISENLNDVLDEYSELWVLEAIHEAALHSGKTFKYVLRILQGWKQHGFKVDMRAASRKPTTPRVSAGHELDHILENTPIFAEDK